MTDKKTKTESCLTGFHYLMGDRSRYIKTVNTHNLNYFYGDISKLDA